MPPAVCDSEHEIWCLAEGDDQPFPIYISSTKFIFNLQELVLAGCRKGYFYDADAKDLILMKVCHITSFMFTDITNTHLFHPAGQHKLPSKPSSDFNWQFPAKYS